VPDHGTNFDSENSRAYTAPQSFFHSANANIDNKLLSYTDFCRLFYSD